MFKEQWIRGLGISFVLGASLFAGGLSATAQDASPAAGACETPSVAASTTADSGASSVAMGSDAAPASAEVSAAATTGLENLVSCLNGGDPDVLASLMTPNMIMFITGGTDPAVVADAMAGTAPMDVLHTGEATQDAAGRVGLPIVYAGLMSAPGMQTPEIWWLVEENGFWKIDGIQPTTMPDGLYPDATILDAQMVDFAFALSQNSVPAGPVIFRFSNTSFTHQGHVGATVTLVEGNTIQSVITEVELPEDQMTGFVGALFVEPGMTADVYIEDLAPGLYTIICDVSTEDGTPHWQLGMVTQFTVE